MRLLAFLPVIFFFLFSPDTLQAKQENWHKGIIFLNNNETVKGYVSYHQELNLVQCRTKGVIKVFTPSQVRLFQYYDKELAGMRVYIPLFDQAKNSGEHKSFYEVVLTGQITLLRDKPRTLIRQVPANPLATYGKDAISFHSRYIEITNYSYYILYKDQLLKADDLKEQVVAILNKTGFDSEAYIKKNNLNLNNVAELIKLIEHYNGMNKKVSISLL